MAVVALLTLELHIPAARSLKDKRMVLRSLKDRLRKHNVAFAETDHQDLWQRAALEIVTVSATGDGADRALAAVVDEIERSDPGVLARHDIAYLT